VGAFKKRSVLSGQRREVLDMLQFFNPFSNCLAVRASWVVVHEDSFKRGFDVQSLDVLLRAAVGASGSNSRESFSLR
jgi:hypothetical protein